MEKCQKSYDIMGEVNLDSKESVMMAKCLKFKYDIYIVVYLCATFLATRKPSCCGVPLCLWGTFLASLHACMHALVGSKPTQMGIFVLTIY